jgi:hypothetical protein
VGASAIHGFGGNSYAFSFILDGQDVFSYAQEPKHMSLAEDEVVQKVWDHNMWNLRRNLKEKNKILTELKNIK